MKNDKTILALLAGAAIGVGLGILFAPDKGSETRKKISKKGSDKVDDLKEKFHDILNSIAEKFENAKEAASELYEKGGNKENKKDTKTAMS